MEPAFRQLAHAFKIEPVTEARAKLLAKRSHPGEYGEEPLPPAVTAAVSVAEETPDMQRLKGLEETLWFPKPVPRPNWFQMARGYRTYMLSKYEFPGFAEIAPGDVVVDCGAYVGAFSLAAVRKGAGRVIAVEPAPVNHRAVLLNTEGSGILVLNAALYSEDGTLSLNLHDNPSDNTLLPQPDKASTGTPVEAITLKTLMARAGVERIDYMKIEAEGAELEIADQVTPDLVRTVVIDAGPERFGQSPFLDLAVLLAARGYRLANRNYWLYARAPA